MASALCRTPHALAPAGARALFDGADATLSTRAYNSLLTLLVDSHRDEFRRVRDHMRAAGVAADELSRRSAPT